MVIEGSYNSTKDHFNQANFQEQNAAIDAWKFLCKQTFLLV